jgi:hypothetical protein
MMIIREYEYIELGPVPASEDCVQVGDCNYNVLARKECDRYMELLEKKFPTNDTNNFFSIKKFPHDFGSYYEVVCNFDPTDIDSVDFAYHVESNLPETWEDQ